VFRRRWRQLGARPLTSRLGCHPCTCFCSCTSLP
jgi:hypothetical protein